MEKSYRSIAVALWTLLACTSPSVAAAAEIRSDIRTDAVSDATTASALDPSTYEGPMLVALPSGGEIMAVVEAGEAEAVAAAIRAADEAGTLPQHRETTRAARCGTKVRSVAGIGGAWFTSIQGCAVFGYPGFQREYYWENASDVSLCTKGKGFNANQASTWYSTGCGNGGAYRVPWGNVLAHTQMQGMSSSWATGAAYLWRA